MPQGRRGADWIPSVLILSWHKSGLDDPTGLMFLSEEGQGSSNGPWSGHRDKGFHSCLIFIFGVLDTRLVPAALPGTAYSWDPTWAAYSCAWDQKKSREFPLVHSHSQGRSLWKQEQ